MFTSPLDDAAPRDLQRGDVVFAHRQSLAMGRGANRLVKCTGLPQLNEMLQRGGTSDGNGDRSGCLDLRVRAVRERVKAARIRHYEGELARAERDVDDLARRVQTPALRDASARAALALFSARGRLEEAKQFDPAVDMPEPAATDYDFAADAAAVPLLRDWTLDGVLINVDDDVLDVETPHDARNDGLLLNVAIAGPTPLRNAARRRCALQEPAAAAQRVDAAARGRDAAGATASWRCSGPWRRSTTAKTRAIRRCALLPLQWARQLPPVVPDRQWRNGGGDEARGSRASRRRRLLQLGGVPHRPRHRHQPRREPGQGPADHGERCGGVLAPPTLLERAGVGAYMKPRDDDADADADEEAARDERQRRSAGLRRGGAASGVRAAPPAAKAAGAAAKITSNCNRVRRLSTGRCARSSLGPNTARATRVRSAWALKRRKRRCATCAAAPLIACACASRVDCRGRLAHLAGCARGMRRRWSKLARPSATHGRRAAPPVRAHRKHRAVGAAAAAAAAPPAAAALLSLPPVLGGRAVDAGETAALEVAAALGLQWHRIAERSRVGVA